jgi:hypothetical protein
MQSNCDAMQIAEVSEREFVHFARLTGIRRLASHHRYNMVGCSAGDSKIIIKTTPSASPRDFVSTFRWREKIDGERKLSFLFTLPQRDCSPSLKGRGQGLGCFERGTPIATINNGLFPFACGSKNFVVSSKRICGEIRATAMNSRLKMRVAVATIAQRLDPAFQIRHVNDQRAAIHPEWLLEA